MRTLHMSKRFSAAAPLVAVGALVLGGCTALTKDTLVRDNTRPATTVVSHCSGSEWMDNSMVAVVPIPIVAFASPTQELNEITTDDVLKRCGPPAQLANRHVEVDRGLCVPLTLTRLITLGVWHWCPADVSWDADVTTPAPVATAPIAPPAAEPRAEYGAPARPNDFNVPSRPTNDYDTSHATSGVR